MPVYAKGYKELRTQERPGSPALLTLPFWEVRGFFRGWKSILLLLVCMSPQIVLLVQVILALSFPQMEMGGGRHRSMVRAIDFFGSPEKVDFYAEMLLRTPITMILLVVYTAVTAVPTVSRDRRWGALELYFARPLRTWHYLAGRWVGASFAVAMITILPILVVWLIASLTAPDWAFMFDTWHIPALFILQGLFFCGTLGLWIVAISSLSSMARNCQVLWVGFTLIMHMVFSAGLRRFIKDDWPVAYSPWGVVQRISEAILGIDPEHPSLALVGRLARTPVEWVRTGVFGGSVDTRLPELPALGCMEVCLFLVVGAIWVLRKSIKPVEVVG